MTANRRGLDAVGLGIAARDITVLTVRWPSPDSKAPARDFAESGGGPVPTALVTMSRLGRRCAFAGLVGDDEAGRFIIRSLKKEGVDASCVARRPGTTSPTSVILVRQDGQRSILEWAQASLALEPGELAPVWRLIDRSRALLVDGRFPSAQVEAASRARRAGALVALGAGHPRAGVDDLIAQADVAILSHSYPRALTGAPLRPERFVRELRERMAPGGARIAGLTLGEAGCLIADGGGAVARWPGLRVRAVDTTGAGDVFFGAFLHALLEGESPRFAARFANAAAALKCRGLTGRAPLPPEDAIRRSASRGPERSRD